MLKTVYESVSSGFYESKSGCTHFQDVKDLLWFNFGEVPWSKYVRKYPNTFDLILCELLSVVSKSLLVLFIGIYGTITIFIEYFRWSNE